jgi:alginate O-acetyltransferase complex protein AlgI
MTLIGIWHGAAWTFVVWGVWHGLLLSVNQQMDWNLKYRWQKLGSGIVTFHLVGVGWIIFGSSSLESAGRFLGGMLNFSRPEDWGYYLPPVLLCAFLVFSIDLLQGGYVRIPANLQPVAKPIFVIASIVLLICLALVYQANGGDVRPFIYGRF